MICRAVWACLHASGNWSFKSEEFNQIEKGLKELADDVKEGTFQWKIELEDVHMNLEQALRSKTEAADKLHTGRSRNDQVATDVRLFFKDHVRN